MLSFLNKLGFIDAFVVFTINNVLITILVIFAGRLWQNRVNENYQPTFRFTRRQIMMCTLTNVLNIGITYAGFYLWKIGWLQLEDSLSWKIILDFIFLFFAMDFLLYVFHVAIHKSAIYSLVHQLHHDAEDPDPIDLFVLHPVETLSFGAIWILLIMIFPFNIYALVLYITFNILFGLVGHLGVEPFSQKITGNKYLKFLGTSTFHHDHHIHTGVNFGFYTTIWDRLFGTLKK